MSLRGDKLDQLVKILTQFKNAIKAPRIPSVPKMPGIKPPSIKNPIKVAEQKQNQDPNIKADLKAAKIKDAGQWQSKLKIAKNGQWSLGKREEEEYLKLFSRQPDKK